MRDLDRQISELRSAKKELFEKARPINDELERIAQHERECVDERHLLAVKKHYRERRQPSVQREVELESELNLAKCENAKLSDRITELEESLDQAEKQLNARLRKNAGLEKPANGKMENTPGQVRSETGDNVVANEQQKQLHQTNELLAKTRAEFHETRQRLSDVQERLTVAEQVTAATQQRELQESDNSEQLQLELTPQHQPTTRTGTDTVFCLINTLEHVSFLSYLLYLELIEGTYHSF